MGDARPRDASRAARVPAAAPAYIRHRPEDTVLYNVVEEHAEAFFARLGEEGASLPAFVHEEFERYLRCGRLEEGFVRVVCTGCRHEHLVAFSCKCRGFCPSCGARRMVESAAGLVDHVLPHVPIRQWVLSFPWPLRFLFAARPDLLTRVLAVVTRALSTVTAHRAGLQASVAKTGLVTFIQRFGSALNLNVHLHILVLDGAYTFDGERPRFHRAGPPTAPELERLLDALIRRIMRTLVRSGALVEQEYDDEEQHWFELEADGEDALTQLQSASIRYRIAVGPIAGRKTLRLHTPGIALEQLQLAPHARHRRLVVPAPTSAPAGHEVELTGAPTRAQLTWAQRLRWVFDLDVSRWSRCGAALRVLAVITEPRVIAAILAHFETRVARAPPPARH